jgi:hypothetical protein
MHGSGSKAIAALALTLLLCACGSKPPPEATPPQVSDVIMVRVLRQVALEPSRRSIGSTLRLAATELGDYFVLDTDHHRVFQFSEDGRLRHEAGGAGTGTLEFNTPVDMDTDGQTLWVLDRQNQRLMRLSRELNYIEIISAAPDVEDPSAPLWYDALACATNGDIFLLDRRDPKAVRISPSGDVLATYGGFGMGAGRLEMPVDLAARSDGSLYIVDDRTLLHFDRAGNLRGTHAYSEPLRAVAVDGRSVWVTTASGKIAVFSQGRWQRVVFDATSAAPPRPVDIAPGRAGELAVLSSDLQVWLFTTAHE